MLNNTSQTLYINKKITSWGPCLILTMVLFLICSLFLFLVNNKLELILLSKSRLLIICIVLFMSKIFMLSFVVDNTIPITFFDVFIKSSFFKWWTFYWLIISPMYLYKLFLLIFIVFSLSVQISAYFPSSFKMIPVFPLSAPELTFTLSPSLNLFAKWSNGYSNIEPSIPLVRHFMTIVFYFTS